MSYITKHIKFFRNDEDKQIDFKIISDYEDGCYTLSIETPPEFTDPIVHSIIGKAITPQDQYASTLDTIEHLKKWAQDLKEKHKL
jgi:hypothetical protein